VTPALEIKNLSLAYGVNRVVRDVSFAVEGSCAFAILGPNGAGKTSILRAISGLMPAVSGDIRSNGHSIIGLRPYLIVAKGVSHVPEGRKIFPEMSVLDNLLVGATVLIGDRKRLRELLERNFQLFPILRERAKLPGGALSGGEQQQLTVARGLMADPKVLIVDEPTLGLAPAIILTMADMFRRLRDLGLTIVIAEQNADFALKIATSGVVISNGQVKFAGELAALRHGDTLKRAYLGG
jgi:branched-chain amino acid transport system ATP-binding protein